MVMDVLVREDIRYLLIALLAVFVSIVGLLSAGINRKFDKKADKDIVEAEKEATIERFKMMEEALNRKADEKTVERLEKKLDYLVNRIDELMRR